MWLAQGNLNVKVTRASEAEVAWLRSKESGLTYGNKKTLFTKGEVELVRFFDLIESSFPAGFLDEMLRRARASNIEVQVIDARTPPAPPVKADLAWLDAHQQEAVAVALNRTRCILQMPTGAGKTEVAIGLARSVPTKWLFLVHRKTLLEQTAARYELRNPGERAGRVGDGLWEAGERFTVATFQTLAAAARKDPKTLQKFLATFGGLIVDEAHVLPADSFWRVSMMVCNAYWRVGVSGTPLDRGDQKGAYTIGSLGDVAFKVESGILINEGRLAKPIIRMLPVKHDFREVDRQGFLRKWDWKKVYDEGVVRSKDRNRALLAATVKAEKPALVFVKDIIHGKAFHTALAKRGVKSDFVWGKASLSQRQAATRRLERRDIDVLVCSVIFQEGVDIPELRSVVIACAGKSVIATLQRIGRGMRMGPNGKETFEVWDVLDTGNGWLERHAKARRHAYQREGYQVTVTPIAQQQKGPFLLTAPEAEGAAK